MNSNLDVQTWAHGAAPGQKIVYHVGKRTHTGPEGLRFDTAFRAHVTGLVFLAQRRVRGGKAEGEIAYEATRISPETAHIIKVINRDLEGQGLDRALARLRRLCNLPVAA